MKKLFLASSFKDVANIFSSFEKMLTNAVIRFKNMDKLGIDVIVTKVCCIKKWYIMAKNRVFY